MEGRYAGGGTGDSRFRAGYSVSLPLLLEDFEAEAEGGVSLRDLFLEPEFQAELLICETSATLTLPMTTLLTLVEINF